MTATLDASPRFRWDRLTVAAVLGYCMLVAALSIGVVLNELRDEFRLSGIITALHGSTFGIGLLFMSWAGVRIVNRIGRRSALILAVGMLGIGVLLFSLGPAWPITLLGTAVGGMGGALFVVIMPGVVSDHHGPNRAAALAAVNGPPALMGVGFSLLIGASLSAGLSWRAPYLGLTVFVAVLLAAVAWPVAVPVAHQESVFDLRRLSDHSVWRPMLGIVNAVVVDFTPAIWGVVYLSEVGGASSGSAPVLASLFGVAMFTSRTLMPRLLLRLGGWTVTWSYVLTGCGALTLVLAPSLAVRTAGLALIGFGAGPLYPLSLDRFYGAPGHRLDSVALGAYSALANGVAVAFGPLALGLLADMVGMRWAMMIVPILCAVGVATNWGRDATTAHLSG